MISYNTAQGNRGTKAKETRPGRHEGRPEKGVWDSGQDERKDSRKVPMSTGRKRKGK